MVTDQTVAPAKADVAATRQAGQRTGLTDERTDLAVTRTVMASDRTLMAWIRTCLSMISFGFTMYKFLQYLRESEGAKLSVNGPRNFGLALIVLGTVALVVAGTQNFLLLKQLKAEHEPVRAWSLSLTVSFAIVILGVLTFLSIAWREGPF